MSRLCWRNGDPQVYLKLLYGKTRVPRTVSDTILVHTELHTRTGPPMTPDSVFAIASNSKPFLAMSVGLLISNETLAEQRGEEIKWSTKIRDLIPEWGFDG